MNLRKDIAMWQFGWDVHGKHAFRAALALIVFGVLVVVFGAMAKHAQGAFAYCAVMPGGDREAICQNGPDCSVAASEILTGKSAVRRSRGDPRTRSDIIRELMIASGAGREYRAPLDALVGIEGDTYCRQIENLMLAQVIVDPGEPTPGPTTRVKVTDGYFQRTDVEQRTVKTTTVTNCVVITVALPRWEVRQVGDADPTWRPLATGEAFCVDEQPAP